MKIRKALIVADPWIGLILDGSKTWEMRSTAATHRGWFGLIRKGSGVVGGVARLIGTEAPLSPDEMIATHHLHRIPEDMIHSGEVKKWNTPWVLADAQRLSCPVPYRHRNGAVTWVELDDDVADAVAEQVDTVSGSIVSDAEPFREPRSMNTSPSDRYAPPAREPAILCRGNPSIIGEVEINGANLRNNHIYLRDIIDFFPDDAIGGANRAEKANREIELHWAENGSVKTDIDGKKKIFRERKAIGKFFELTNAEEGDRVLIEEIKPYEFRLRLTKVARA